MKKNIEKAKLSGPVLVIVLLLTIFVYRVSCYINFSNASALTYSNNIDLEYTYATTLDIAFSSNTGFIIDNLTPGTSAYSNTVTITASSNNSDGFTMSATAGNSNDVNRNNNSLVYNNGTTNYYFESIAINANIAELTNLGTNKWGYTICEELVDNTCSSWSNYNGLPAISNNNVNDVTLASSSMAGSTDVLMRIGASSTNTQVSGTFTNNINFTITANIVTYDYSVTYNANDGNPTTNGNNTVDTTNMPANETSSLQTGQTLLVSNQIPTRAGYEFLGWCDGTSTDAGCTDRTYQSEEYIKINNPQDNSSGNTNSITLSAIWGTIYMQDLNLVECQNRATNAPITVYDKRDESDYTIRYIAGACWMTQNLRITHSIGQPEWTISKEYSNFDNVDTWNIHAIDLSGNNNTYTEAASHAANDADVTSTHNLGYVLASDGRYVTAELLGTWYNFCAASANNSNGCNRTGNYYPADGGITGDICPVNWHLPSREIINLLNDGGVVSFALLYSGQYYEGTYENNGFGVWWLSDYSSTAGQYRLRYSKNEIDNGNRQKALGTSIRCVRTS